MSCWWDCTFSLLGSFNDIERFRNALPALNGAPDDDPLWHAARIKAKGVGFLCVEAFRNYGGTKSVEQMIHDFPALTFVGSISTDMDLCEWWTFEGRNGETAWHEHSTELTEPFDVTKAEIERDIREARERIAREEFILKGLIRDLALVEPNTADG